MSSDFGPPPEPGQFDRPFIHFGHAAPSGEPGRTPSIPSNTPSGHEAVPAGAADPGASPIDTIRIDGQPSTPLMPTTTVVPGRGAQNVMESAAPAPDVTVAHLDLTRPAGHQTTGMRAAPDGLPRSPVMPTHIAPSGFDAREAS